MIQLVVQQGFASPARSGSLAAALFIEPSINQGDQYDYSRRVKTPFTLQS
jgi:hypothetical protein